MKCLYFGVLAACLFSSGAVLSAEKGSLPYSTNSADEVACQRQLNRILGAIQEYQKRNQTLPPSLSDLVPEYIHDRTTLICPFVRGSGIQRKWRSDFVSVPVFGDPAYSSYAYEFSTQAFPFVRGWTTRTYKERQLELIGLSVPIVRCLAHRRALNLGFDGSLYQSSGEWEDIFVKSTNQRPLLHRPLLLTNISGNKLVFNLSEPRKPDTDARMLDLSLQYNALLLHLSQIETFGKLLMPYPEGAQKIGGIDFDVRGLVHLGASRFPVAFPETVENLPVNRKCGSIHFLHGATSAATNGSKIATFVLHFTDGRTAKLPIIYGIDVKSRWFDAEDQSELDNPKPAWISPPEKIGPTGNSLRLYVSSWKNKTPDSEVASIDFVSGMTQSAPFLLAITVE